MALHAVKPVSAGALLRLPPKQATRFWLIHVSVKLHTKMIIQRGACDPHDFGCLPQLEILRVASWVSLLLRHCAGKDIVLYLRCNLKHSFMRQRLETRGTIITHCSEKGGEGEPRTRSGSTAEMIAKADRNLARGTHASLLIFSFPPLRIHSHGHCQHRLPYYTQQH